MLTNYHRFACLFFVALLSCTTGALAQSDENIALTGATSQSSTGWGGVSSRAIDGNTSGVYRQRSITHTLNEKEAWWEVSLATQSELSRVVLYNRTDNCCTSRLADVHVFLSEQPFGDQTLDELLARSDIASVFLPGVQETQTEVPLVGIGNYVRVQLAGTGPLSLAEVEVFGHEAVIEPPGINLALTGVASQSSTGWGGVSSRAIDGNTSGVYRQRSVTHTLSEPQPWWEVGLESQSDVSSVVLYNRTDNCCTSRLTDVYVFLSEESFGSQTLDELLARTDIEYAFLAGAQGTQITVPFTGTGSYVRVQRSGTGPLSLAEVEVYGAQVTLPPIATPDTPINLSPAVGALIEAGTTQNFVWQVQAVASTYEFRLLNNASEPLITIDDIDPTLACNEDSCSVDVDVILPVVENNIWQVRAKNGSGISEWSSSNFDVTVELIAAPTEPLVLLPADNAVLAPEAALVLQWQADAQATSYDIGLYDPLTDSTTYDANIDATGICSATVCSISKGTDFPVGDGYQFRLRATNRLGSSDWVERTFSIVVTVTAAPSTPINIAPDVGVELVEGRSVEFSWSASDTADSYDFHFFDKTDGGLQFTNGLLAADVCVDGVCRLTTSVDLPILANHAWRVRASNAIGNSGWSRSVFNVIAEPDFTPAVPVNLTPAVDSFLVASSVQLFTWEPVLAAQTYDFHLFDVIDGELPYVLNLQATDICSASVCEYQTELMSTVAIGHAWRVRAVNEEGTSDWSRSSFTARSEASQEPLAQFTLSSVFGPAPLNVVGDASSAYDAQAITDYSWDFGGVNSVEGSDAITASHEFVLPGTYTVTLTVSNAAGFSDTKAIDVTVTEGLSPDAPSEQEAARLLAQASFGASTIAIQEVRQLGLEQWIDEQLELTGPSHLDYVSTYSNGSNRDARHEIWWLDAVDGHDQLRQRVAFALSQLLVVSDTGFTLANAQYGVTNYYDILRNNAFGNFRELLEQVTLNPVMGIYLSMLQNDKGSVFANTRADENFAREVLQLFSIGLYNLNNDGSLSGGNTFTQDDIESFARVFTGWNYKNAGQWERALFTGQDLINPMEAFEDHHDTDTKTLLGGFEVPAGQSARADLEMALDNIFSHQNVAPFISTHLIKQLVTSNPTPAYISRVASVFNDNGNGIKGDLGATVKAILMDAEARELEVSDNFGKLREPVLRLSHLWRAFSITPGNLSARGEYNTYSTALKNIETITGQAVLRSASVFNFYSPSYAPSGPIQTAQLIAPEFDIFTDSNILSTASRINDQIHRHYKQNSSSSELNPSYLDFALEIELAEDPQALLDHLNLLLLSGAMSSDLNTVLVTHLNTLADNDAGHIQRVQDAVSLIVASPEYLIQK